MSIRYIALLRGINVGGNNIIKMAELKICFESMGFDNVKTYIQSGNILFDTGETDKEKLTNKIEKVTSESFGYNSSIVLITQDELKNIVEKAPKDFGKDSNLYRYDVLFLKSPVTAEDAIKDIKTREGVDNLYKGNGVLYFSRLISHASKSYLSKIILLPVYKKLTIRNWNTTTKMLVL